MQYGGHRIRIPASFFFIAGQKPRNLLQPADFARIIKKTRSGRRSAGQAVCVDEIGEAHAVIFKTAILQKRSAAGRIAENVKTVCFYMKEAARNHADILLLPECFLTGYQFPVSNDRTLTETDAPIAAICRCARENGIGVVLTSFIRGDTGPQDAALVIDRQGIVRMKYVKVHTCDFADERCLENGTAFPVCDFDGVRLGVMICYDREYPESARILMLNGAEIILVPNDCGTMQPRVQALSTRAYENMTGVAMANPNGPNAGNSCAFSPICWDENGNSTDNTLLWADEMTEGLFYASFDLTKLRAYRASEMMGNTFRKVDAYGKLTDGAVCPPFIRDGQSVRNPAGKYTIRRKDRAITDPEQIKDIIDACDTIRIGLSDGECPYIVPMNFGYEMEGMRLSFYVHGAMAGRKYELMKTRAFCSFEMDCAHRLECLDEGSITMRYRSVMGTARIELLSGDEKARAVDLLMNRDAETRRFPYDRTPLARTMVARLTVTEITAKANEPEKKSYRPGEAEAGKAE